MSICAVTLAGQMQVALVCRSVVALGIPGALSSIRECAECTECEECGGKRGGTPAEIAERAGADAGSLPPVLRAAAAAGILTCCAHGHFSLATLGQQLLDPDTAHTVTLLTSPDVYEAWSLVPYLSRRPHSRAPLTESQQCSLRNAHSSLALVSASSPGVSEWLSRWIFSQSGDIGVSDEVRGSAAIADGTDGAGGDGGRSDTGNVSPSGGGGSSDAGGDGGDSIGAGGRGKDGSGNAAGGSNADEFGEKGTVVVVDVGGSTGELLRSVASHRNAQTQKAPDADDDISDLPRTVRLVNFERDEVIDSLDEEELTGVECVAGDFFDPGSIPVYDVAILKWICHDFDDGDCVSILSNVASASRSRTSKIVIIEPVVPSLGGQPSGSVSGIAVAHAMRMTGGFERTEAEWRALLAQAGVKVDEIVHVGGQLSALVCTKE